MAFREKSAWVMVLGLSLVGILCFSHIYSAYDDAHALPPPSATALIPFTVVLVVFSIVGHILVALVNPKEAYQASDERDKKVVHVAGHRSGIVLGLGILTALLMYLIEPSGALLFYVVFFSFWLANLVEYGLHLYLYRAVL